MSSDSDPLDQAFPDTSTAGPEFHGDPLDAAFAHPASVPNVSEMASVFRLPKNAQSSPIAQQLLKESGEPSIPQQYQPQGLADTGAGKLAEAGYPAAAAALHTLPTALTLLTGARIAGIGARGPLSVADTQAALNRSASTGSMGAAATAPNIMASTPDLQEAISAKLQSQGSVNHDVLARHVEADSLQIPIRLTEGQATQNPNIISNEQNIRGKVPQLAEHFNQQNSQLIDNLRSIRENTAPNAGSTTPVEHGDVLINAYKDKAAAADADISAKYKALKDANGGDFPVDAQALMKNSTEALHSQLLFDHAPKAVMNTLGRLADNGNMTFENYESLRTNLARIQRSSQDGNERAAAGVIRDQMEQLPLQPGSAELKPLADQARSAAKAQFQALEADPAYKAAVNDLVPPDRFVQRFVTGPTATRDGVATMRQNLSDNDTATQTMGAAALDHLRDQARVDAIGNGNFSQAGFNRQLDAMRPKLPSLVSPEQIAQLDTLGKVARYTQFQPRGSYVNTSNTLTGALAGHAANTLEGMANVAAKGVPVGTFVRKAAQGRALNKLAEQATEPGAGL